MLSDDQGRGRRITLDEIVSWLTPWIEDGRPDDATSSLGVPGQRSRVMATRASGARRADVRAGTRCSTSSRPG
jgi:hypothetical protein